MPANRALRAKTMYAAYQAGQPLDAVAAEYGLPPEEVAAEFRRRALDLKPADAERFPAPAGRPPRVPRTPREPGAPRAPRQPREPGTGRRQSRHDPVQLEQMFELYQSGKTLAEVAAVFGTSAATVGNVFKRAGYDVRARGTRAWTREQAEAMYAEYQSGTGLAAIAEKHDLSSRQVRSCFRQHDLPLKATTTKVPLPRDQVQVRALYARYESGEELEEIAETAELSVAQLKRLFMLHHLPLARTSAPTIRRAPVADPATRRSREAPEDFDPDKAARELHALYQTGRDLDAVAEFAGLDQSTVLHLFQTRGLSLRPTDQSLPFHVQERLAREMFSLVEEGYDFPDIAAVYGCSAGDVQRIFAAHGLAVRPFQQRQFRPGPPRGRD